MSAGRPQPSAPNAGTRAVALELVAAAGLEAYVPSKPMRANRVWSTLSPSDRRDVRTLLVRICQEIADDARRRA
jgi:hypothetical protein